MPQGSILGLLLFLTYIISDVLNPTMFADGTSLFYWHKDINAILHKVNNELHKISQWFISNTFCLDVFFFHKRSKMDDIPLLLAKLKLDNYETMRTKSIKILVILIEESLTWKPHIMHIENKTPKILGLLLQSKPLSNKQSLLTLYYSYIQATLSSQSTFKKWKF